MVLCPSSLSNPPCPSVHHIKLCHTRGVNLIAQNESLADVTSTSMLLHLLAALFHLQEESVKFSMALMSVMEQWRAEVAGKLFTLPLVELLDRFQHCGATESKDELSAI